MNIVSSLRKFIDRNGKYIILIWGMTLVLIGIWGNYLNVEEVYMTFPRRRNEYVPTEGLIYIGIFIMLLGIGYLLSKKRSNK